MRSRAQFSPLNQITIFSEALNLYLFFYFPLSLTHSHSRSFFSFFFVQFRFSLSLSQSLILSLAPDAFTQDHRHTILQQQHQHKHHDHHHNPHRHNIAPNNHLKNIINNQTTSSSSGGSSSGSGSGGGGGHSWISQPDAESTELEKRGSGKNVGWSTWSDWSTCSRSCDGGIAQQLRRCHAPQGCRGEPVRYKICNMQVNYTFSFRFSFFAFSHFFAIT